MQRRTPSRRNGPSIFGVLVLAGTLGLGMIGLSATAGAKSPNKISGIPNYKNTLAGNTKGWCPVTNPPNLPCDGGAGNYGTITIVKSSFANYGGYAASVPGPGGQKKYARVSGGMDGGVPTINGCSVPGNENCSGPYTKFGSTVHHAVSPPGGSSTSIKIYIVAAWPRPTPATGSTGTCPRAIAREPSCRTMRSTCAPRVPAEEASTSARASEPEGAAPAPPS